MLRQQRTLWTVEWGLHSVIFKSDSQTLVSALRGTRYDLVSAIGVLLKEARSRCIGSLESFSFQFVSRNCNVVAHSLAQYGLRVETEGGFGRLYHMA